MAATIDKRPASSKAVATQYGKTFLLETTVDFTNPDNQLAQNETMALFDIAPGIVVNQAFLEVITPDGDIGDVDLGCSVDGSTAAELLDGATLVAEGYVGSTTYAPKIYNEARQVVLTNNSPVALDEAVVRVIVLGMDMTV